MLANQLVIKLYTNRISKRIGNVIAFLGGKRELDKGKVLACHQVHSHSEPNPIVESDQSWPEYNPTKVAE